MGNFFRKPFKKVVRFGKPETAAKVYFFFDTHHTIYLFFFIFSKKIFFIHTLPRIRHSGSDGELPQHEDDGVAFGLFGNNLVPALDVNATLLHLVDTHAAEVVDRLRLGLRFGDASCPSFDDLVFRDLPVGGPVVLVGLHGVV